MAFPQYLRSLIPPLLTFQLVLGGQARLTSILSPSLYKRAMAKAEGTRDALYPFIPVYDPVRHSNVVGAMMMCAGALVWRRETRVPWGVGLTLMLTSMGIYSQRRMKIPYWLPVVNSILAITIWYLETH